MTLNVLDTSICDQYISVQVDIRVHVKNAKRFKQGQGLTPYTYILCDSVYVVGIQ